MLSSSHMRQLILNATVCGGLRVADIPEGFEPIPKGESFDYGACIARSKTTLSETKGKRTYGCLVCWIYTDPRHRPRMLKCGARMVPCQPATHLNATDHLRAVKLITGQQPMIRLWKCPAPDCDK